MSHSPLTPGFNQVRPRRPSAKTVSTVSHPYGKLNRALPTHICRHPDGLLVRVARNGVTFQAMIPNGYKGDALAAAIARRDHFLKLAGAPHQRVSSNTGILGISESVTWRQNRSYPCFFVQWSAAGHRNTRRFTFGPHNGVTRSQAFAQAKAFREQHAGPLCVNPTTVALSGPRSADWQSAVSQIGNLRQTATRSADWQSAVSQIGNLRQEVIL